VGVILLWVGVFPRESLNPVRVAQLSQTVLKYEYEQHAGCAGQQQARRRAASRALPCQQQPVCGSPGVVVACD
jgi:hypothetical protein